MKGDNAERTRNGYAEFNAGDVDALVERLVPDFQWNEAAEIPGPKSFRNREEFVRFMRGFDLLWEEFEFVPLELEEHGEHIVYARMQARGRGKASAEAVDFVIHHLWRLEDGLFVRMDAYLDEAEARDAIARELNVS